MPSVKLIPTRSFAFYLPLTSSSHFQAPDRMRFLPIFPAIPFLSIVNDGLCFPAKISSTSKWKNLSSSVNEEEDIVCDIGKEGEEEDTAEAVIAEAEGTRGGGE